MAAFFHFNWNMMPHCWFYKKIRGGKWKLKWHFNIKCRNRTRTATDSWTRNISYSTGQFTRLVRRIDDISVSLDIFIFYHTIVIYMLDTKPLSYDMSIDPLMITASYIHPGHLWVEKLWRHKCILRERVLLPLTNIPDERRTAVIVKGLVFYLGLKRGMVFFF
jgi:hypothetical protein